MPANRQVSPLAVILLLVAALAGGGLVVYLLYSDSDPAGPQLIAAVPAPAPPPLVAVPAPAPPPLVAVPAPAPPPLVAVPAPAPPPLVAVPAPAPPPLVAVPAPAPPPLVAVPAPAPAPAPAAVQADPVPAGDGFATVSPDIAESDVHPQVQQQGLALVEAVVGQYEAAWPWVRQAWERSDVRFYDRRLPAPCDRAGVVGCVSGGRLLLTLQGVQSEETVLHELGHVWNNTAGEDWRPIQQAFADHYAGCYSRRASTPERLQTELLVDAMVIAAGAALDDFNPGGFGYYEGDLWSDGFDGCLVDSSEPPPHLLGAIRGELFNCSLDADAAAAEARAQAIEESESGFRLFRTGAELRADQWAAMAPRLCAHTAAAQERTVEGLAAMVSRVEELIPAAGSEVLAQQAVGLDLTDTPRYVIELFLNGQRLPDAEMLQATSTNRAVYQPGQDRAVEKLRAGESCARAVFYPLTEGSASARRGEVRWCFRAS